MTKFGKFLEEDDRPKERAKAPITTARPSSVGLGDNVSVKIKAGTLKQLQHLKTIEGHKSYAALLDHLIERYIQQADKDLQDKLNLLQD